MVFDLFSKRKQKKALAGKPDVYQYENLPQTFRVQVIHILNDAIGPFEQYHPYDLESKIENNRAWKAIYDILCRELGVFSLSEGKSNLKEQCLQYLLNAETDNVLDIIEISFRIVDRICREYSEYERNRKGIAQEAESAVNELNARFFEHGIGFQYDNGELIRVDSQFIHEEVVKSALTLVSNEGFRGGEDEFRRAHEHYRFGRHKEALNEALKSFESVAKSICDKRKWTYPPGVTSKGLIDLIFKNGLIASELQAHFTALRAVIESGVPAVRNKQGGHGQGTEIKTVPAHLVGFILHSAAAAIVLMVQAHREMA